MPLLRISHLSKQFGDLRALDDVSLDLEAGEIVALVGQNGSGKSTLVKILAGVIPPDVGSLEFPEASAGDGAEGRRALHFIHQDLGLVPSLSTIENLDLGRSYRADGLAPFHHRGEVVAASRLIASFGTSFDVTQPVSRLSSAERTIVAIARALDGWVTGDNVLVLDEPTASLHGGEVERLFGALRRVAARGAAVLFISHRLDEVLAIADRVAVLRDGRLVASAAVGELDDARLVSLITGGELAGQPDLGSSPSGEVVLGARGVRGATVRHADLDLHAGEILGVSGILGSGREHLCELLFGTRRREAGSVHVSGVPLGGQPPRDAIRAGMGFVPGDRHAAGMVAGMTLRENLTLANLRPLRGALFKLSGRREREETGRWISKLEVRPPLADRPLALFSGGNQQKIVLGKWLRNAPRVLLLDEPTQGVDVGAKVAIYTLIAELAAGGAGVLLTSSDTKELEHLCDRVLVFREGTIAADLPAHEASEERLTREALGIRNDRPDTANEGGVSHGRA